MCSGRQVSGPDRVRIATGTWSISQSRQMSKPCSTSRSGVLKLCWRAGLSQALGVRAGTVEGFADRFDAAALLVLVERPVVDGVAVQARGGNLMAILSDRRRQGRGAGEQVGAEGERPTQSMRLHRPQDAEDADPVPIVPRREVPQVGIRRHHPVGVVEGVLLRVDGVELAGDHDHH